jgi:hypothetical protein
MGSPLGVYPGRVHAIEAHRDVLDRARQFQSLGYGAFDSLHLASTETGRADVLQTTNDKFIKRAARGDGNPQVPVLKSNIMLRGSIVMIAIEKMSDAEFDSFAFDVLRRELGAAGLARFLRLHRSGPGDYTADRVEWQQGLSVDDIAESIRRRREKLS